MSGRAGEAVMVVNGVPLEEGTLHVLRSVLGNARVDEIGRAAVLLGREYRSVEEIVCFAEHLRLMADRRAREEGR